MNYKDYVGEFKLKYFARIGHNSAEDFPVAIYEVPPGIYSYNRVHDHDTFELAFVIEGTGTHIMNGSSTQLRAGDVLLIYPKICRHGYDNCLKMGMVNILYDPSKLPIPLLDGTKIPLFRCFFPQNPERDLPPPSPA